MAGFLGLNLLGVVGISPTENVLMSQLLNTYIVGRLIRLQSLGTKWFIMTTNIKRPINIPERFSVQSLVSLLVKKIYFGLLGLPFFSLDKGYAPKVLLSSA